VYDPGYLQIEQDNVDLKRDEILIEDLVGGKRYKVKLTWTNAAEAGAAELMMDSVYMRSTDVLEEADLDGNGVVDGKDTGLWRTRVLQRLT